MGIFLRVAVAFSVLAVAIKCANIGSRQQIDDHMFTDRFSVNTQKLSSRWSAHAHGRTHIDLNDRAKRTPACIRFEFNKSNRKLFLFY